MSLIESLAALLGRLMWQIWAMKSPAWLMIRCVQPGKCAFIARFHEQLLDRLQVRLFTLHLLFGIGHR